MSRTGRKTAKNSHVPGANAQTRGRRPLTNAPGSRASAAHVSRAKKLGGGAADEDAGYLAYVEYDVSRDAANLIVIDAQRFRDDPVVVIELPMHVPYTFHGAFVPK